MTCHPWQGHYCGRRAGSGLPLTVTFRCRCELLPPVSDGTCAEGAHRCGRCSDPGPSRYRQSPGQGRWPPILPVSWETSPRKLPASCRKSQPARNGNRGQETKNFELTRHDALLHPLVGSDNQRNPAAGFLLQQLRAHLRTRASRIHGVMTCCSSPPGLVSLGH
jgi:hypothetical protein